MGDISLYDGIIKYTFNTKLWTCQLCNYSANKYNRQQIHGHVRSKHNNTISEPIRNTPIPHLGNNITNEPAESEQRLINMEPGYDRIKSHT